jgi:demethylmenaquinone methyltransferase/2-methoxy-6-polyprenyl-1,4-benzoquinol methylase
MIEILRGNRAGEALGFDLTPGMLRRAKERLRELAGSAKSGLVRGDGEALPYRDGAFDAVVSSFVMRNVGDRSKAYREIARVLKPGGTYVQLEMARPRNRLVRAGFLFYFQRVMPWVAGLIAGDRAPYQYLAESLDRWPHQDEVAAEIGRAGFARVDLVEVAMATAAIHRAMK